jgi:hypothetical protein
MRDDYFCITEREGYFHMDNWINYESGPFAITISCWTETITIKFSLEGKPEELKKDFIETITIAWGLKEDDFVCNTDSKIQIKINYEIIKKYMENLVVFGDPDNE